MKTDTIRICWKPETNAVFFKCHALCDILPKYSSTYKTSLVPRPHPPRYYKTYAPTQMDQRTLKNSTNSAETCIVIIFSVKQTSETQKGQNAVCGFASTCIWQPCRAEPIMLKKYPIMPCCTAPKIFLLCSTNAPIVLKLNVTLVAKPTIWTVLQVCVGGAYFHNF